MTTNKPAKPQSQSKPAAQAKPQAKGAPVKAAPRSK
jgi:hypothetical protein